MKNVWGKAVLMTVGVYTSGAAVAQEAPMPPPAEAALPDRPQIEQNIPPRDATRPSVRVKSDKALEAAPCALRDSDIRVTFTRLALERADGSPLPEELQGLLSGVDADLHGEQSVAVVCTVRDRINARLDDAGYVALAQIPAQQITDGVLRMQIVTGRMKYVRVVGEPGPFKGPLMAAIERIQTQELLNRNDAVQQLLLAGDIPGLDVTLSLSSANEQPGEIIGTFTVSTQRFALMANVQNFGSKQLGRWIGSLRGEAYGLTGMADRTFVAVSNTFDWKEVHVVQAGHDFALTDSGLRLGFNGSLAWSRPDIKDLDLRSRSIITGVELSAPLMRTLDTTLIARGGFEMLEQRARFHSGGESLPFTLDKIRVFYARLDGDFRARNADREWLRAFTSLELRKGVDVFGASKEGEVGDNGAPSRLFGNPQATVVTANVDLSIRPANGVQFDLSGFGQWADDPLLNLEEFSVGNYTHGRGYDPGVTGGDRAYGFTLEPRIKLPVPRFDVEASAFYDHVHIENLDRDSAVPKRTLRSVGAGLRFMLPQRLVLDLTYAHPLDRVQPLDKKKPSDRFLVSITAKLK